MHRGELFHASSENIQLASFSTKHVTMPSPAVEGKMFVRDRRNFRVLKNLVLYVALTTSVYIFLHCMCMRQSGKLSGAILQKSGYINKQTLVQRERFKRSRVQGKFFLFNQTHSLSSIHVYISYFPFGGCCNQLWGHTNALAISTYLNASLILPSAWSRDSFSKSAAYKREPLGSLLDSQAMIRYWGSRGVSLLKETPTEVSSCATVDLTSTHSYHVTNLPGSNIQPFADVVGRLYDKIYNSSQYTGLPCVHLKIDNPIAIWDQGSRIVRLETIDAARGLLFPRNLRHLASIAIERLVANGFSAFNGVHLRIEEDWRLDKKAHKWASVFSLEDPILPYITGMRYLHFDPSFAIFAASGVFHQNNETEIHNLKHKFIEADVGAVVFSKQDLLKADEIKGLHSEQLALLDFLVLSEAERIVGDGESTFASFLREYRNVLGYPRETFAYIEYR